MSSVVIPGRMSIADVEQRFGCETTRSPQAAISLGDLILDGAHMTRAERLELSAPPVNRLELLSRNFAEGMRFTCCREHLVAIG